MARDSLRDFVAQLEKWALTVTTESTGIHLTRHGDHELLRMPVLDVTEEVLDDWLRQNSIHGRSPAEALDYLSMMIVEAVTNELVEGGNTTTRVGLRRTDDGTVELYSDRNRATEYEAHLRGLPPDEVLEWRAGP